MKPLIAVIALTAFLRLFQISSVPAALYWDELDTGYQAYSLLLTGRDYFGNLFPVHLQSFADYRSGLYMYLTVPFVKLLGLNPLSVRLPAALFSLLAVISGYLFSRHVLGLRKYSWVLPLVIATAPWTLIQGRISAESQALIPLVLLAVVAFFRKKYEISAVMLGLCLTAYPTAKLFIPVLLGLLLLVSRNQYSLRRLVIPGLLLILFSLVPLWETVSRPVSRRFSEVSVFSDPTITKQVEIDRQQAYLGRGGVHRLGLKTGLAEWLTINKYTIWGGKLISNYATSLSTNFLFIAGDPNPRHHPGLINTGQFYLIQLIPFVLGLFFVFSGYGQNQKLRFLLWWMLLSPLSSAVTRDGATHGPRLIFSLIPLASIISLGISRIFSRKFIGILFTGLFGFSIFISFYYFLTSYRVKTAVHFDYGFTEGVQLAWDKRGEYQKIILDGGNQSFLMAYLFTVRYPPAIFQNSFPLLSETVANGVEGYKFDNVVILYPGTRDWNNITMDKNNLLIVSSLQPHASELPVEQTIYFPDSTPAFIVAKIKSI